MNNETLIRAWKDARFRSTLDAAELPENPAGERLVEVDDTELRAIWGGQDSEIKIPVSEGYVCTTSGEKSGMSCWN
jgi:mersacidin/lichenicidin family type 2 lantibiotic